jgi:hypothetical protein
MLAILFHMTNFGVINTTMKWMTLNKLHLIYQPKDNGTFKSVRWGKDYTPNLSILTRGPVDENTLCNGYIIESFPKTQHRSVLLYYGIRVTLTESIEKPRWNFPSVDWASFAADIDHVLRSIPACLDSYERTTWFS